MTGPFGYYLDPDRGAIPEWGARFAVMAWADWLTLDAVGVGQRVRQPVAMIHSRDAAVPDGAQAFHDALADARGLTGSRATSWTSTTGPPRSTPRWRR